MKSAHLFDGVELHLTQLVFHSPVGPFGELTGAADTQTTALELEDVTVNGGWRPKVDKDLQGWTLTPKSARMTHTPTNDQSCFQGSGGP